MKATALNNTVSVLTHGVLPDGDGYVEVTCADFDAFKRLPAGIRFESKTYGLTGWNSDSHKAYYKMGRKFAEAV